MAINANDPVVLALKDFIAGEKHDEMKEACNASGAFHVSQAIIDRQVDGHLAPLAEWFGKTKVHGEIAVLLLGAERGLAADNAKKVAGDASKATANEKAKASVVAAEYAADKARIKGAVQYHEAAMTLFTQHGVTWKHNGEDVLFPATWFFPFGDKPEQAAPKQPLAPQYVTASRTKGFAELDNAPKVARGKAKRDADHYPAFVSNETAAEYAEVQAATPNARTALASLVTYNKTGANLAAMLRAAKPTVQREQDEEQAPAIPVPEAAATLASSLAAADYEISGEAADAFLDMVAAFIAASDSNRSAIVALLNEGAKEAAQEVAA